MAHWPSAAGGPSAPHRPGGYDLTGPQLPVQRRDRLITKETPAERLNRRGSRDDWGDYVPGQDTNPARYGLFYGPLVPLTKLPGRGSRIRYGGSLYDPPRYGFVVDYSFDMPAAITFTNPGPFPTGALPPNVKFIGHMPECVFDELTMTNSNPAGGFIDTYDQSKGFVAFIYQVIQQELALEYREISGVESFWYGDKNPELVRERLILPFRSRERMSVTYGGPLNPGSPTYLIVYPQNVSLAEAEGWRLQITARFVFQQVDE